MGLNFEQLFKKVWDDKESRNEILKVYFTNDEINSFSDAELKAFLKDILIENLINNPVNDEISDQVVVGDDNSDLYDWDLDLQEDEILSKEKTDDGSNLVISDIYNEDSVISHENLQFTAASDEIQVEEDLDLELGLLDLSLESETVSGSEMDPKKLVFLGPPNVGKTSIIQAFFYKKNPNLLCEVSFEPTKDFESEIVQWSLIKLGIFDLSGQELNKWFGSGVDTAFGSTDELIVVFDCRTKIKTILNVLKKTIPLKKKFNIPYIYIFLHKTDLLPGDKRSSIIKKKINSIHQNSGMSRLRIFGTSLRFFKKFDFILNWCMNSLSLPLFNFKIDSGKTVSNSLLDSMKSRGELNEPVKEKEYVEVQSLRLSNTSLDQTHETDNIILEEKTRKTERAIKADSKDDNFYKMIKKFYIKEEKARE